jgi:hypothetical protein
VTGRHGGALGSLLGFRALLLIIGAQAIGLGLSESLGSRLLSLGALGCVLVGQRKRAFEQERRLH